MTLPADLPLAEIAQLCHDYGVSELALFGSVASGEARADSDIDFLYVLSDPTIGIRFFEFHHRLADLLGRTPTRWISYRRTTSTVCSATRCSPKHASSMPRRDELYLADVIKACRGRSRNVATSPCRPAEAA